MNNRIVFSLLVLVGLTACGERDAVNSPTGTPGAPIILQFAADPGAAVAPGDSVTLTWQVEGQATALSLEPGIGTVTGRSVTVSPVRTTTYKLTASNAEGTHTAQVTVNVESQEAPPDEPEEPAPPEEPETLNEIRLGRWAFEITPVDGQSEATSGVLLVTQAFSYGEYRGAGGEVLRCSGSSEVCDKVALGGIFRSRKTDVLYFGVGTLDYTPLFVGEDADGAFSRDQGQPTVQGEGEIQETDAADFTASFIGE